jgi:TolA-binding protein
MADPPDLQGAIAIEAVEWTAGEDDKLTISVRGRWRRRRQVLSGLPALVIEAEGRRHRFTATPEPPSLGGAPPGGWQMTFTVPAWLAPHLGGRAWLQLGLAVVPLPRAVGAGQRPIDPDTLSERRMRTAELAEHRARARVSEAEAVVVELTIRVQELERSLKQAQREPDRLRELLAERDQQRRVADQRAHAEYAMRLELEEELAGGGSRDDERRRLDAGELAAAEERVRELELELEDLHRRVAEAEQLAAAARAVPDPEPAAAAPFDLRPELEIAARPARATPAPLSGRTTVASSVELRALRDERGLIALRGAPAEAEPEPQLHDTIAALRHELGLRAAAEARATSRLALAEREAGRTAPEIDAGRFATVLADLRAEFEQLAALAQREASVRTLTEQRVRELERRIAELEVELHDRDERARRAFDGLGELRALLARLAGGTLDRPPAAPAIERERPPEAGPAAPEVAIERFDDALARLRAAAEPHAEDAPVQPPEPAAGRSDAATTRWLREAFTRLLAADPATAGELLVALLAAQGTAWPDPIAYDFVLAPDDVIRVTSTGGGGARAVVEHSTTPRALEEVAFRASGDHAQLARLIVAGPFRRRMMRRGLARVEGARSALAAPEAILDTQLGVAELLAVLAGEGSADVSISGEPGPLVALLGWLGRAQHG